MADPITDEERLAGYEERVKQTHARQREVMRLIYASIPTHLKKIVLSENRRYEALVQEAVRVSNDEEGDLGERMHKARLGLEKEAFVDLGPGSVIRDETMLHNVFVNLVGILSGDPAYQEGK